MAASAGSTQGVQRHASLTLSRGPNGQVLTAQVPHDMNEAEFQNVTREAYRLVNRLTGCNCMSGRISFVVEDVFAEAIRVELGPVTG
jgi:hypothetical protein